MRNWIKWGDWEQFNEITGYTPKKKVGKTATDEQRAKFSRCKECGGKMTYIKGSNILICENKVEKEIKTTVDGEETKSIRTVNCGNINMVADKYQSYLEYLFA